MRLKQAAVVHALWEVSDGDGGDGGRDIACASEGGTRNKKLYP